jgi:diguanylate cyclase (GGDEF)-like protein/PAS domain S-box-containing protein
MSNAYTLLTENLPQKIFYKDCQSVYISCNKNFARDLHIHPDKIIGKTDYDFFAEEIAEKYRASDRNVIDQNVIEETDEKYTRNGKLAYVRTIRIPVSDVNGTVIGVMGITLDITPYIQIEEDRKTHRVHIDEVAAKKTKEFVELNKQLKSEIKTYKQIENVLRKSEDRLKAMFESAGEAIVILDLKGRIKDLNNATLNLYRYNSKNLLIGRDALILIATKDHDRIKEYFKKTVKNGINNTVECTFVTRDETEFIAEMSLSLLKDKSGNPAEIFTILRDITDRKRAELLLKESEMKYKVLAENSLTGIYIHQDGKYGFVNEVFAQMHGYTREELIGKDYLLLNYTDDREIVKDRVSQILKGQNKWRIGENRRQKKDGTAFWCQLIVSRITYKGRPAIMGNVIDITERKLTEEALIDEATRRRILIEQSRDGIVVLDHNGKVNEVNQQFAEMLGYSIEEARQLHVWDWDTQWTREQLLEMVRSVDTTGDHFETCHRRKDGTVIEVDISTSGSLCGGQKLVFCVCRDITERKRLEQKLSEMATHDALTGLPNRILLTDRFDNAIARAKRETKLLAVMMLDLDRFKDVNDSLGHDIGDKLLKAVSNRLISILRGSDTVARIGGDEFVLLISEIDREQDIERIAQKILDNFIKPFIVDKYKLKITTSMGIAVFPEDGNSFEYLMMKADKAMYRAKEEGRNNYKFLHDNEMVSLS